MESVRKIKGAGKDSIFEARLTRGNILELGDRQFKLDIFVAPIADKLLLGLDFLSENCSAINFKEGSLSLAGSSSPVELKSYLNQEMPSTPVGRRNAKGDLCVKSAKITEQEDPPFFAKMSEALGTEVWEIVEEEDPPPKPPDDLGLLPRNSVGHLVDDLAEIVEKEDPPPKPPDDMSSPALVSSPAENLTVKDASNSEVLNGEEKRSETKLY